MSRRLLISISSFITYVILYLWITTIIPEYPGEQLYLLIVFGIPAAIVTIVTQASLIYDCIEDEDSIVVVSIITIPLVCIGAFIQFLNLGSIAALTCFIPYAYLWTLALIDMHIRSKEYTIRSNIREKEERENYQQWKRTVDNYTSSRTLVDGCDTQTYGKISAIQSEIDQNGFTLSVIRDNETILTTNKAREAIERAMVESTKVVVTNNYINITSQMDIVSVIITGMGITVGKYFKGNLLEI